MAEVVSIYLPNGLADWELGFITPGLNTGQYFTQGREQHAVKAFGLDREPITSMGGLVILPDLTVDEVGTEKAALLLLPGSDTWLKPRRAPVLEMVREFLVPLLTPLHVREA